MVSLKFSTVSVMVLTKCLLGKSKSQGLFKVQDLRTDTSDLCVFLVHCHTELTV